MRYKIPLIAAVLVVGIIPQFIKAEKPADGEHHKPNLVVFISDDLGRLETSVTVPKKFERQRWSFGKIGDDIRQCVRGFPVLLSESLFVVDRVDACSTWCPSESLSGET